MELADKWGIKDYPSPAGGCKLTEPNYAKRLKDLLKYNNSPDEYELEMLKIGRHFRTSESAKIISTRTKDEADEIKNLLTENELIFLAEDFNGSMVIVHGKPSEKDIEIAAKVAGRYCKGKNEDKLKIKYGYFKHELDNHIEVKPGADEEIDEYII
jgi:predicted ribosome quality control (RQC) complex YloA/Tae2 family protein